MTINHTLTIHLDLAAQHRLDRLLDLLELAVTRSALSPEEIRDVAAQIREQSDKLRAAAGGPNTSGT